MTLLKKFLFLCVLGSSSLLLSQLYAQVQSISQQVTASDYCDFLNSIAITDVHHLYDEHMATDPDTACIIRFGLAGQWHYELIAGREKFSISYVSWFDEARYCNWLQSGKSSNDQDLEANEDGAYTLGPDDNFVSKNSDAIYRIADDQNNNSSLLKSSHLYFTLTTTATPSLTMIAPEAAVAAADEIESLFGFLLPLLLGVATEGAGVEEEFPRVVSNEALAVSAAHPIPIGSLNAGVGRLQLSEAVAKPKPLTAQQIREHTTAARLRDILLQPDNTPIAASPQRKDEGSQLHSNSDQIQRRLFPPTPDHVRQPLGPIEEEITGMTAALGKMDPNAESDASPNSSDDEYGAKTLMRKIVRHVGDIHPRDYAINQDRTEEITEKEIQENPGKFYVANFRGDHLDYFGSNRARRMHVKQALDSVISQQSVPCKSIAVKNIEKKYKGDAVKAAQEFARINISKQLKDPPFIKKYKSPKDFSSAVKDVSPEHGNPGISTSKDAKVGPVYADHPKKGPYKLHPKYSDSKKPKHRLIGMTSVIVHEANEYIERPKADLEKLRTDHTIGGKCGVERDNQEILFHGVIASKNIAGYVPLAYPNLSKPYSSEDKKLFGLEENRNWSITKSAPKTLGKTAKDDVLYPANRRLQWRLAEKYATDRNPEGELIWVDGDGKFNRFRINQKSEQDRRRGLLPQFEKKAIAAGRSPDSLMLDRIRNPDGFYDEEELTLLIKHQLPANAQYIDPTTALMNPLFDKDINQEIIDFNTDKTKKHLVIAIHSDLHFMGIHIVKNSDESFSITSFDPTVSTVDNKPLHPIPAAILVVLNQHFPGVPIINTTSRIQTYSLFPDGAFMIDNNHCGPFVAYFMTEMARGNARLAANGSGNIELKFPDEEWITINALSKKKSDDFGKELRNSQEAFLLEKKN